MKTIAIFLVLAVTVISCSGELPEYSKQPHSLFKRKINCPPKAICLPATQPPPMMRVERSPDQDLEEAVIDGDLSTNPIVQMLSGHRQKRGSKPVPIIYCNRRTGKCTRM